MTTAVKPFGPYALLLTINHKDVRIVWSSGNLTAFCGKDKKLKLHLNFLYVIFCQSALAKNISLARLKETMKASEKETNVRATKDEEKSAMESDLLKDQIAAVKIDDSVHNTLKGAMKNMELDMASGKS